MVTAKIVSTAAALPKAAYVIGYHVVVLMSEQSTVKAKSLTAMDGSSIKYLS